MIYNLETNSVNYYNGSEWLELMGCSFPDAPGSISGSITPYENETGVAYSIDAVTNVDSYTWTVPSGSSIASGQGTISITVDFGTTNGDISVRSENNCGNVSTYTNISITLQPAPTCTDGIWNGSETDIDCGGPDCDPCR